MKIYSCFWLLDAISSVQSLICVRLFVIPWTAARQASLSITSSRSLLKLTPLSVMDSSKFSVTPFESSESPRAPCLGGAEGVWLVLSQVAVRMAPLSTGASSPTAPQSPGCLSNKLSSVQLPPSLNFKGASASCVLPSYSRDPKPPPFQA